MGITMETHNLRVVDTGEFEAPGLGGAQTITFTEFDSGYIVVLAHRGCFTYAQFVEAVRAHWPDIRNSVFAPCGLNWRAEMRVRR